MLDKIHPWGGTVRGYRSREIFTAVCSEPWQERAYWALRRSVFVSEQGLFNSHDRDEHDEHAYPIVALSTSCGMPDQVIGVVRIYPQPGGIFFGGRLAVCHAYRRHGIVGEKLIKRAVGTAKGLGCQRFYATVQAANVRYFQRHHFVPLEPITVMGQPHSLMEATLRDFEPLQLPPGLLRPTGVAA